ncbi:4-galactosyl-N-acetylglucosaminide 3-alpha-L-fucosyltransferase 9-like [Saccostrea echinata]|uniref:4-galactosyl-N-acetylglucosaminide 3-alpha-L-fucosyltransferase 9-like n=1 Tax=Saccostrea echinata TaxID=191078 RepID=UPI002A80CCD5|nr:4-galactosyl-N-acetylglucosaminide 3-alpha-L-fucosyltransferase 9-like [Saccostrea echinata]
MELSVRVFVVFFISTGFFFLLFEMFSSSEVMHVQPVNNKGSSDSAKQTMDEIPTVIQNNYNSSQKNKRGELPTVIQKNYNSSQENKKEYRILWYNIPFYLVDSFNYANSKKCKKHPNCLFTKNSRDLQKSDVVLFTHSTMGGNPPPKKPNQMWIFNTMENTAFMSKPSKSYEAKLDWLMSYRRKSDIYRPYGTLIRRTKPLEKDYSEVFKKKKKLGVWMSGHCPVPSNRRNHIKELKKYIEIDMFGTCGNGECLIRTPFITECLRNFSRDYKFYFSYENNICEDYTTEKTYNMYLENLNMVPIINGPSSAPEYLPKGSFISALDFPSPKALAEKIKEIASNEALFTQYLKEKDKYYEIGIHEVFLNSMCQICDILDKTNGKPERPKGTIMQRYFSHGEC